MSYYDTGGCLRACCQCITRAVAWCGGGAGGVRAGPAGRGGCRGGGGGDQRRPKNKKEYSST
jgi:hypothetical protein